MTTSENYPAHWRLIKIGDVCRVRRGASPRPIDSPEWFSSSGRGWVRIVDVTRSDGRLRSTEQRLSRRGEALSVPVEPGQLIMSIAATIGVPAIVEIPVCIHDGFVVFDQYERDVDTTFLFHFINYYIPKFRSQGQTGTQPNLNTGIVNAMPFPLPPLDEQRAIAAILDTIDAAIQNAERVIAKQKSIRAGLLDDLLTYGLDANGEPRDVLTHPEQFQESPLGLMPRDWDVVALERCLTGIDAGKSPDCPDIPASADEWGVLKVSAVKPDGFDASENKVITNPKHIVPAYEVRQGDLLITRANTYELVGIVSLVIQPISRLMLSDKTLRLNVNKKQAELEYLFYALQMPYARFQIEVNATGSSGTMKNISQETIAGLSILRPPLEEQRLIVQVLNEATEVLANEQQYRDKLIAKKKGLMDDLLTGRVRVGDGRLDEVLERKS